MRDETLFIYHELWPQGVDPGGFQPQCAPVGEVAPAGVFEFREEIGQHRVTPLVFLKVLVHSSKEGIFADPRDELFENRATLGVGDPIEIDLNIFNVIDRCDDGVRGR